MENTKQIICNNPRQAIMLKALAATRGNVGLSADIARIHRRTHYYWLGSDPEYKYAVDNIPKASPKKVCSKFNKI